jgi:hypothetical protein
MGRFPKPQARIPKLIHWINIGGIVALGLILLLTAVVQPYQLILVVAAVSLLGILYWWFRSDADTAALFLAVPLTVTLWIVLCENITMVDKLLGTDITSRLSLSVRLESYVAAKVPARQTLEGCCNDSLSYQYKPGTMYRRTYDCPTCFPPYEATVDETGRLNREIGFYKNNEHIDCFLAGDSVMQGWGVPSVLEYLKVRIPPTTMWNLSVGGYGPRERVSALIAYALPKKPKWLLVEFYSANDTAEALELAACETHRSFRCRFNPSEMRRQLARDPTYGPMLIPPVHIFPIFQYYTENSLTLAVTRSLVDAMKSALKRTMSGGTVKSSVLTVSAGGLYGSKDVAHPGQTQVNIDPQRLSDWIHAGIRFTHEQYQRLVDELAKLESKPTVILIYNPSAYEIYRGNLVETNPEYDAIADFQFQAQRSFAEKSGWMFLDLTIPLRDRLAANKKWIYGRHDTWHWSPEGTGIVADVLAGELTRVMETASGRRAANRLATP